ncbi:MAG TPA: hypothetical protein VJ729_01280 [Nitrososphaeraceae archaeon]|nr:hypothetical protein [Nitrososphaeraceae archaeon]
MADINIFRSSVYLLYKNPILFVLPSIGSMISIIFEAFYIVGLRNNNNNQNYFPLSDIFILFLFFISFAIAYFQLILISKKIIPKRNFENKNYYNIIIFELLVIYSFYALTLVDIGGYEADMRGKLATTSAKTGHFSIYISKISIQNASLFVNIISFGIPLVLLLSIISLFFNAWMVQYILLIAADETRNIRSNILGLYQSLSSIVILTVHEMDNDAKKNIALLFILSTLISTSMFVLTDIAVIPVADGSSLYMLQFAILNIIGAIYSPFFLVCLFLTFMSRPFYIDDNNILP